jgi:hypothetical protein
MEIAGKHGSHPIFLSDTTLPPSQAKTMPSFNGSSPLFPYSEDKQNAFQALLLVSVYIC